MTLSPYARKALGRMMAHIREKHGHTQKDVADALGLYSAQFISNVERGVCSPTMAHLKLARTWFRRGTRHEFDLSVAQIHHIDLVSQLREK